MICDIPLEGKMLAKLRLKAQRCGAWFRLKMNERRLLDLVITVVKKVRNFFLARILEPIVKKLLSAIGNAQDVIATVVGKVAYWITAHGRSLAQRLSQIAQSWGNKSASKWLRDNAFIKYLAVMNMPENRPL
jgi:hypothetical protein